MKHLFYAFLLMISLNQCLAKESILIAFNAQGILGVTSQLVIKGIHIAFDNLPPKTRDKLELIEVSIDDTINGTEKALMNEIQKKRPLAIIGAATSNQAFLINVVSLKEKIPFITPFATHPDVTKKNTYALRTCFDDVLQTTKLADFIYKNQKLKNGLVLYNEKQSYAIGVKNTFIDSFSQFKETKMESLAFSSVSDIPLAKIKELKPEFIVLPSYQVEAATILSLISKELKGIKMFGTDSWGGGRLFHSITSGQSYPIQGFYVQHWSPEFKNKQNQRFLKLAQKNEFFKKFDSAAMLAPSAVGYDALRFVVEGFTHFDKGEFIDTLKQVSFNGLTGTIHLKGEQTPSKPLFIYRIDNKGEKFYVAYP